MAVSSPSASKPTTLHPVPKPRPLAVGALARRLAHAQGQAFRDVAADLEAVDALSVARLVDRRRDEHVRQALRLVRLARRDRANASAYLALAAGHLGEAIRLDGITDEHGSRATSSVGVSIDAGRAVIETQEMLLTGRPSCPR